MLKTVVGYHGGGCYDGFASYVVARLYHEKIGNFKIDYLPLVYGNDPGPITADTLYLIDYSFPYPKLIEMLDSGSVRQIIVIDHHKTFFDTIPDIPDSIDPRVVIIGNPSNSLHSGAGFCWKHFFPNTPAPIFLELIQDWDTWKFKLSGTKELNRYLSSVDLDYDVWLNLFGNFPNDYKKIMEEAKVIERAFSKQREQIIRKTQWIEHRGLKIAVLNNTFDYSQVASDLLDNGADLTLCYSYNDTKGGIVYSVRSNDKIQALKFANEYGGGGHAKASGFRNPQRLSDEQIIATLDKIL